MELTVFLPCRKGSERVKNKNTRPFAGVAGGLIQLKLEQLSKISSVTRIVVSSNDEEVKQIARNAGIPNVIIDNRPDHLASSQTSTDDLVKYVPSIIQTGSVLWTHVTSPFINSSDYEKIIKKYSDSLSEGYDSLMTVNKIQKFLWNDNGPINYNRAVEKWPRTQTLPVIYEVNSGVFIADIDHYKAHDRIGKKPFLYETEDIQSFDIDWEHNFKMAELIWKYGEV